MMSRHVVPRRECIQRIKVEETERVQWLRRVQSVADTNTCTCHRRSRRRRSWVARIGGAGIGGVDRGGRGGRIGRVGVGGE